MYPAGVGLLLFQVSRCIALAAARKKDGAAQIQVVITSQGNKCAKGFFAGREGTLFPFPVEFNSQNPASHC